MVLGGVHNNSKKVQMRMHANRCDRTEESVVFRLCMKPQTHDFHEFVQTSNPFSSLTDMTTVLVTPPLSPLSALQTWISSSNTLGRRNCHVCFNESLICWSRCFEMASNATPRSSLRIPWAAWTSLEDIHVMALNPNLEKHLHSRLHLSTSSTRPERALMALTKPS